MQPKHSKFGIASFALGLVTAVLLVVLYFVAGALNTSTPGGISQTSSEATALGLLILLLLLCDLTALILATISLFQKGYKQLFPILGTLVSLLAGMAIGLLFIIGKSA
jgi:hypothetical protein